MEDTFPGSLRHAAHHPNPLQALCDLTNIGRGVETDFHSELLTAYAREILLRDHPVSYALHDPPIICALQCAWYAQNYGHNTLSRALRTALAHVLVAHPPQRRDFFFDISPKTSWILFLASLLVGSTGSIALDAQGFLRVDDAPAHQPIERLHKGLQSLSLPNLHGDVYAFGAHHKVLSYNKASGGLWACVGTRKGGLSSEEYIFGILGYCDQKPGTTQIRGDDVLYEAGGMSWPAFRTLVKRGRGFAWDSAPGAVAYGVVEVARRIAESIDEHDVFGPCVRHALGV